VALYGDVVLRYVSGAFPGPFLAAMEPVASPPLSYGLERLDHAVGNTGSLVETLQYVMGFTGARAGGLPEGAGGGWVGVGSAAARPQAADEAVALRGGLGGSQAAAGAAAAAQVVPPRPLPARFRPPSPSPRHRPPQASTSLPSLWRMTWAP
jgi:hypothetical protein